MVGGEGLKRGGRGDVSLSAAAKAKSSSYSVLGACVGAGANQDNISRLYLFTTEKGEKEVITPSPTFR